MENDKDNTMGFMNVQISGWDAILMIAVCLMGTLVAYVHDPGRKAFILLLPIPFSIANLSLGLKVDVSNVLALLVLYGFTQCVRILYNVVKLNIVVSIVISAAAYCAIGITLAKVVPKTEMTFWISSGIVLAVGLIIHFAISDSVEPGYRTSLPVWKKLPIIAMVVTVLVLIKLYLQGFMTIFPMVGVIATYESRYSLGMTCRKIGSLMFVMLPMIVVMHIAQTYCGFGIAPSIGIGWIVFLPLLFLFNRDILRQNVLLLLKAGRKECVSPEVNET